MEKISSKLHLCTVLAILICSSSTIHSMDGKHSGTSIPAVFSKSAEFEFADLVHKEGDPDSYTLMCLDSNLIPASERVGDLEKIKVVNPIKDWLRKELLEKTEKEDALEKLYVDERKLVGEISYYLVRLYLKPHVSPSEHLTTRLWGGSIRQIDNYEYSASMLIFPQPNSTHALAYLLGTWSQLLNPHTIIHDWGLRLAATQVIFSDKNIKTLLGKNNFDPNPTSRREKKQRLASIESFALEVGTEGLQSLTVLPKYALKTSCQRLVVGSDWYKFFLPAAETGKSGDTISSLVNMANYLYNVYRNKPAIHSKLRYYLDDEVIESQEITELNKYLSNILPTAEANLKVFPADNIWKYYGLSPSFSYGKNKDKRHLLEALKDQKLELHSLVSIKKARSKTINKEPINRILYSLPIEFKENFYRFDRGRWFKVAASRFSSIIQIMRDPSVKVNIEALLPYTLEDAMGEEGNENGGHYQEDRYNRRIVATLTGKNQKGILLDRLNIYFNGQGNKFEFGDMLLYDDKGQYYIVHVKRREARDIDHHRAQVERCAEYLATELKKENAKDLLLQGCINGLYLQHEISINKIKGQEKRLTHSKDFKDTFTKKERGEKLWNVYLKEIFKNARGTANLPIGKLKTSLRKIDLSFFEKYQEELIVALDALHDCSQKKELLLGEIQKFFEAVKQLIEVRNVLFPSGLLTEATRKKATIVMAVIDDRNIEPIRKAEEELKKKKEELKKKKNGKGNKNITGLNEEEQKLKALKARDRSNEGILFNKQQLWGLDRTRQLVQKHGFKFNLMVINENKGRPDWDAFGSTKEDVVLDDIDEDLDQEEMDGEKFPPREKKAAGKKRKKESEILSKKDDSRDDPEKRAEREIPSYQYTSTDINRLLHLSLAEDLPTERIGYLRFSLSGGADDATADTNDIVHCLNNSRYVLPPIVTHPDSHEEKNASETLIDHLANSFFKHAHVTRHPPEEMIIPFNPGGHWVTFHVLIPNEGDITFKYIDSLNGSQKSEDVRVFQAFLRGKYWERTVKLELLISRIQPDGTSCGAITVENIKDLFRKNLLPDPNFINLENILKLKKEHRAYLKGIQKDFDFDPIPSEFDQSALPVQDSTESGEQLAAQTDTSHTNQQISITTNKVTISESVKKRRRLLKKSGEGSDMEV